MRWSALEDQDICCLQDEKQRTGVKWKKGEREALSSNRCAISWIWVGGEGAGFKTDGILHESEASTCSKCFIN